MRGKQFLQNPRLDQVFMVDEEMLGKLVSLADLKKTETVLEIGTGSGNLTKLLAEKSKKVITIEIDTNLKPFLKDALKKNVRIIWGNALEAIENKNLKFDKIVSNPPFSISEPLIKTLFIKKFKSAVLTLPWNFVERLTANPEDGTYSKLSLFSQVFFRIETLVPVHDDAWSPKPGTKICIVRIFPKIPKSRKERIIRELILQPDKKLKNALREAIIKSGRGKGTKREAKNAIEDTGFPEKLLEKKISEMGLEEIEVIIDKIENVSVQRTETRRRF